MNRKVLLALAAAAAATLTASPALARDRHHGGYNRGGHGGISINLGRGGGYYGGGYGSHRYAPQAAYYNDPYYYDQRVSYRQRGYYDNHRGYNNYRGYRRDHHDSRREYRRH
ncbi:hypothetical protein ABC347_18050 [Sphingomonas sp. 1P06PA]|uniref:hypothetical protein n=1 Tax=Sphingomonas sp. 1P06PA TaxID=554121 RepID=UPI0039A77EDB